MPVAPHQRDQAAMFRADRIQFLPTGQEVVIDGVDHVKTVGDNPCLRKVLANQGTRNASAGSIARILPVALQAATRQITSSITEAIRQMPMPDLDAFKKSA